MKYKTSKKIKIISSVKNQPQARKTKSSVLGSMITLTFLICFCIFGRSFSMVVPYNNPIVENTLATAKTLSQDLDEIARTIPFGSIQHLITRYLPNDEQFQAFDRLINSNDAYVTLMRFRSHPDVMAFNNWVRQQILLSGGDFELDDSNEHLNILNFSPFCFSTVNGWYYPEDMIRSHIQLKIAENGILALFVQRLQALKPVYDSITALPAAQSLAASLEAKGINTTAIDSFIRNQFGWQQSRVVVTSSLLDEAETSTAVFTDISATTDVSVSPLIPGA